MVHVILFVFGCCIGSFVNVVFSRKDWYKGRSRCDECGYLLKWYDLIPVVSYVMLRGKCRKCKTEIEASHLISELMMGTAFFVSSLCFERYGIFYGMLASSGLIIMAVAAVEDYKEQMVYNWILLSGIVLVTGVKCAGYFHVGSYINVIDTMGSVFVLKLLALAVSILFANKIGSGDFDILIVIFLIGGISGLVLAVTYASLLGCIIYLPDIVLKKRDKKAPLPFIPLLLMGTMCFLII